MFNGYFIQALQNEFYRLFKFDATTPVITKSETELLHDFGFMYLMGPLHTKDNRP